MTQNLAKSHNQIDMEISNMKPEHLHILNDGEAPGVQRTSYGEQNKANLDSEKFGRNVERLHRIGLIYSSLDKSSLNYTTEHKQLPDAEEIELLLNIYDQSDDGDKKKISKNVLKSVELGIKHAQSTIKQDLIALNLDRGVNKDDANEKAEEVSNPIIKEKRKYFGNITKDDQINVLEESLAIRNELLLQNVPGYLSYLDTFKNGIRIGAAKLEKLRTEYDQADGTHKLKVATQIRKETESAINDAFEVNLARLKSLKELEGEESGKILEDIYNLRIGFLTSSMPGKVQLIENLYELKHKLAGPHSSEISDLRSAIERDLINGDFDSEDDDEIYSLQEEVNLIDELLVSKIRSSNGASLGYNPGASIDEMQEIVKQISIADNNPKLKETFQRVIMLRTSPSDFFDL